MNSRPSNLPFTAPTHSATLGHDFHGSPPSMQVRASRRRCRPSGESHSAYLLLPPLSGLRPRVGQSRGHPGSSRWYGHSGHVATTHPASQGHRVSSLSIAERARAPALVRGLLQYPNRQHNAKPQALVCRSCSHLLGSIATLARCSVWSYKHARQHKTRQSPSGSQRTQRAHLHCVYLRVRRPSSSERNVQAKSILCRTPRQTAGSPASTKRSRA